MSQNQDSNPQLLVGPNSSSSLIKSDSSFISKKITLNGDNDGVGLFLNNSSNKSITSLGGVDLQGKIVCKNSENVSTCGNDVHASVELTGGMYVSKKLQVGSDLCVEGTILNKDMATKNNLVSSSEHVVLDILYANKIYCININGYSESPPSNSQTTPF